MSFSGVGIVQYDRENPVAYASRLKGEIVDSKPNFRNARAIQPHRLTHHVVTPPAPVRVQETRLVRSNPAVHRWIEPHYH